MFSCFNCIKNNKNRDSENVYVLDFSHSSLQDVPPEIFDYERTLNELNLGSNRIRDLPPQLFLCHELKTFCLSSNDICVIPPAIGSLTNLIVLDLFRNNLTYSSIPENIKQCKQIKILNLSVNLLEKLPDSVTHLINLEELYLNDTAIEFLQANCGRLTKLRILELRDNRLETLTKSLSRLIGLCRIDLGHNRFSDFPEVIGSFENLTELILDENMIEEIPTNISNLKKLIYFDCSENDLIEIPNEIQYLTRLQDLNLSANKIEEIPNALGSLINLINLKLNNNNINSIPDIFGDMKYLEELTLSDNFLTELPPSIGQLRRLKFLTVDNNFLQILPHEIASCTNLTILSLHNNNLVELPPDIGHLSNLIVLNIVNNNIINLPMSILNLSKLMALWISDNQSQPMVQLQKDHDEECNFFLTCYMLPQIKNKRSNENPIGSQDNLGNGEIYQEKIHIESKAKHICFSNEPAAQIDRPGRLLRSPTPYPKELRTMAKTLNDSKNSRISINESGSLSEPPQFQYPLNLVKEARISNNLTANDEMLESSSLLNRQDNSQNYDIPHPLELARNLYIATPNIDEFDSASSYCHSQNESNINSNRTELDMMSVNSINSQEITNQTQLYKQRFNKPYEQYSPKIPGHNMKYNAVRYENNNQSQVVLMNQTPPRVPPPYHIAKNYSKISTHEMIIYDSIRNRTNLGNIYENTSNIKISAIKPSQKYEDVLPQPVLNNNQDIINMKNNNNDEEFLSPSNVPEISSITEEKLIKHDLVHSIESNEENSKNEMIENKINVDLNKNINDVTSDLALDKEVYDICDDLKSPSSPNSENQIRSPSKTKPWLFGKHRNPMVMQFSIKRNNSIPFSIAEIPNFGICINEVEKNCDASEKLRKMDKVLDIDGFDFTKNINLSEANKILFNTGTVINIMISRI